MPPSRLLQVAVEAERALLCPAAKAAPLEPMAITGAEKAEKPLSSDMQQGEAQGSPTQASGPTLSPRMGIHNLDRLKSSTSEVLSPSPESGQHPFQLPPHNQHAVDRCSDVRGEGLRRPSPAVRHSTPVVAPTIMPHGEESPRTFVRLSHFFHGFSSLELYKSEWMLKTCYIKSKLKQFTPPSDSEFWSWRVPNANLRYRTLEVHHTHGDKGETRRSLYLRLKRGLTGCMILVALQAGQYWIGHRVGQDINPYAEAALFGSMDLSGMWVETATEAGPLCEHKVGFGNGSLLIKLSIEKPDGPVGERYKVHLDFVGNDG